MSAATVRYQILEEVVLEIFVEEKDQPGSSYNFMEIGFSRCVAKAFLRAFVALQGANVLESQRAGWIQIKRFGNFVAEKFGRPEKLPQDCLSGFDGWMIARGLGIKSIGGTHNTVIRMLQWCLRNTPNAVHPKTLLFRLPMAAQAKESEGRSGIVPDEPLLRKILSECYAEIEEIEKRIYEIRQLPLSSEPSELADLLMLLLQLGGGVLATQEQCLSIHGGHTILARLGPYGGLRGVYGQYYLSMRDVFPFYLAILVQTSGNPQSLLRAHQDCIVNVPMRQDLERIVWDKERAKREQAPDFPKDKKWSAPNIVRKLKLHNEELRVLARPKHTESLFLCRNLHGHVAPPSWQAIHNCLLEFRQRHSLPKFDLSSLRPAGGKLHHQVGRSLVVPKQRLQHTSESTTQIYTPLTDIRAVHDKTILRFQGLLISASLRIAADTSIPLEDNSLSVSAETVFGFGCQEPRGGIALGSRKGEVCPQFHQCATCRGALVVVDDPISVAKLIRSKDHLIRERDRAMKEGWSRRFELLYAPTLAILQRDILPSVSSLILERARTLSCPTLPLLE
jgi:hypothetical protein